MYDDKYYPNRVPDTRDIALPFNTENINEMSIDIGGSLTKVCYSRPDDTATGVRLCFYSLETDKLDELIEFIKNVLIKYYDHNPSNHLYNPDLVLIATGGGAYKFYDKLRHELHCTVQKEDEMQCLIVGLDFFVTKIRREVFYFDEAEHRYIEVELSEDEQEVMDNQYPYLLVNIGSGVSMIKVTGPGADSFVRVGGSSLGGGTLWGLLSILTDCRTFDEMLEMAAQGNNENVDLLVGDIYGQGYNSIGLKANHIASSMGKVYKRVFEDEKGRMEDRAHRLHKFQQRDIARSLLYAVSNNIGQVAYLQAQRYNLKKIYFAGSYIRNHYQTIRTLSYAIDFWSEGRSKAYFLRHEGFLGSMGAFLMRRDGEPETHPRFVEADLNSLTREATHER
ncbi:DEKNAAC102919 [Brettanomyces naardenensis]|uniref:DEKNAAC102919 n=1 Tax=Brettanomyces naardenensis TaxID=13370 RepID=A0A448YM34_BRENA|nr:DEKNAAC102919 [Brettanomyces naardenensis]